MVRRRDEDEEMECDESTENAEEVCRASSSASTPGSKRKISGKSREKGRGAGPRIKKPKIEEVNEDEEEEEQPPAPAAKKASKKKNPLGSGKRSDIPKKDITKVAGRIVEIRLENFMCHSNTVVPFSFDTNNCHMMTGPNGSGKSSIFAAMNIGLGGKGHGNDRGNSVKDYVQTDKPKAKIRILLTNRGQGSHPDYGDFVIIERTISAATGASTYALKMFDNSGPKTKEVIVSKKKSDVDRLVARYGIQLTNPIFWLSQDRARSFLQDMKPSNLYQLFINATELERTSQCYEECERLLGNLSRLALEQKALLKQKVNKFNEMQIRLKNTKKIETMKNDLHVIMWKLIYCPARDAKDKLDFHRQKMQKRKEEEGLLKQRIVVNRDDRERFHADSEDLMDKVKEFHDYNKQLNEAELEKKVEITEIETVIRNKKKEIAMKNNEKKIQRNAIKDLEAKITKVRSNSGDQMKDRLAELERNLKQIVKDLVEKDKEQKEANDASTAARREMEQANEEQRRRSDELREVEDSVRRAEKYLQRLEAEKHNAVARFGVDMPAILRIIEDNLSKFSAPPKGPLGKFVILNEEKWALPVETTLGPLLSSFLFNNSDDSALFRRLLSARNILVPNAYVIKFGLARYKQMEEPPSEFVSMYRVLDIQDDDIHNLLIDQTRMEQIVLIERDEDARDMMYQNPPLKAMKAMTLSGATVFPSTGGHYRYYAGRGQNQLDNAKLLTKARQDDKSQEVQQKLTEFKNKLKMISKECNHSRTEFVEKKEEDKRLRIETERLTKELQSMEQRRATMGRELKELRAKIADLGDEQTVDGLKVDIEHCERLIAEVDGEIAQINDGIKDLLERMKSLTDELEGILKERKHLIKDLKPHEDSLNGLNEKIRSLDQEFLDLEARQKKMERIRLAQEHDEIECEKEYDTASKNAKKGEDPDILKFLPPGTQIPPNFEELPPTKDTNDLYEAEKLKIEQAEKINKDQGIVTPQMLNELRTEFEQKKRSYDQICSYIKKLRQILEQRVENFQTVKHCISVKLRTTFTKLMGVRQYRGDVEIDMEKERIKIKVDTHRRGIQMEDVDASGGRIGVKNKASMQDLRGLSGGERSFTTACFIMSLWEVMEAPFRCMDEFDVFMDMVNRKVTMDMIVKIATEEFPFDQFILFTPQGVNELSKKQKVEIIDLPKVRA